MSKRDRPTQNCDLNCYNYMGAMHEIQSIVDHWVAHQRGELSYEGFTLWMTRNFPKEICNAEIKDD